MRTSRISQETSKVIEALSPSKLISRRQTRSFAASIGAFTADTRHHKDVINNDDEESDEDNSSLSSVPSAISFDIEDQPMSLTSPARKRKRDVDSPSTTITASISARTLPRKASANTGNQKVKKARRQPAKKTVNDAGEVEIHPPANWEEIYDAVKEMRKTVLAPVDTMGCETLAEENITPRVI